MSFSRLLERFRDGFSSQAASGAKTEDPLRLATAAVLLEIAHADGEFSPAEDGDVVGFLKSAFQLDEPAVRDLIHTADDIRQHTIDHFALTNYIRRNATLDERIEVVKTMWRVAYSDGRLTDYENYLVRKLADLLGIEHRVMIDAKVDILRERGESV
ncbi:MAG TPA: TerB family tellurite resistance protein [Thermoanaerobaculia bacterium]